MQKDIFFTNSILKWSNTISRDFPWKHSKNPYHILLSEFILQQTRVEQGLPYYLHFIQTYPTIFDLANASEDQVLKSWQGLGYYSRARNLRHTARSIVENYQGVIPNDYNLLLSLKGIGPYTAAAIASFAFKIPKAVVDGNVIRVLTRYYASEIDAYTSAGKKSMQNLADTLINTQFPGEYNQAIMDLGATVCTPRNPTCDQCPVNSQCVAYQNNQHHDFPIHKRRITKTNRYFHYLIIHSGPHILIHKRTKSDIWRGLFEFPLLEQAQFTAKELKEWIKKTIPGFQGEIRYSEHVYRHNLTHQNLFVSFHQISTLQKIYINNEYQLVETKNLRKFAFPQIIDCYLSDNLIYLE